MGLEKGLRPTSPVHVHVEDDIPVHVHVKSKGKKSKKIPSVGGPVRSSLAKKSTAASRARSKSPGGSWVPPPGRATKGTKLSWQGPTHRLEVHTPRDSLRMSDLSSGEEDQVHDQMRNYEKKIDNLLTEVGTLKNEVELQKSLKEIERQDELLEETRNVLSEQEKELDDCKDELDVSIHENRILKKSLNMLSDEMDYSRSEALALTGEREKLMKKLIEVEMDGQAAIKQMGELRDAVRRLREENRMSNTDCNRLAKQKDLLLEKLSDFESTNRTLRRLLRDQHYAETAAIRVAEQRDHLLRKLSENDRTNELSNEEEKNLNETSPESLEQDFESFESRHFCSSTKIGTSKEQKESPELATKLSGSEAPKQSGFAKTFDIEQLRIELLDNERLINDLRAQIAAFRDENASQISLQQSLESTRAHLQKQLRTKDADCNRMAVQIRTLEGQRAQDKIEIDHLQELLSTAKDKADRDKEALKKATRVQKQRATRSEDAMEQLNAQLLEKESQLEDLRTQLEQAMPRCDKMAKEKAQIQAENSALKTRLGELESLLDRVENNTKVHQENVHQELHQREAEIVGLKTENERLKCSISTIEEKFKAADTELIQLRGNIREYENLIDEYKSQISRSRQEADDTLLRLEDAEREKEIAEQDGHYELEKAVSSSTTVTVSSSHVAPSTSTTTNYFPLSQQPILAPPAFDGITGLGAYAPALGGLGVSGQGQVKARLQNRLQELEPLPEMLKTTELRLHDANERMLMYERKNSENTKLIAELTTKVEHVSDTLEQMRGKCHDTQDENRLLQGKIDTLERKLSDADDHARELMTSVAKAEEAAHQQNLRLEEKARENASLTRQLENALSDLRRQSDQNREKSAQKERTLQTRISDLESQLSQCRAEMARLKREKEENERKFNSRLYDLKDRLEQSHSTNRSMQNYVQFLKNSYANVFGESSMSYPSTPIGGDPGNLH